MLLLHDRLEWFDIGIGIDAERVRHPHREGNDTIELGAALEDHHGSGALGCVSLAGTCSPARTIALVVRVPRTRRSRSSIVSQVVDIATPCPSPTLFRS